MMSPARILVLAVLAAVIGLSFLLVYRDGGSNSVQYSGVDPIAEGSASFHQDVSDSNRVSDHIVGSYGCIPITMVGQSPEAYRIDKWYQSWGAPPSFNLELSSRPYAHYTPEDIEKLSRNGDVEATQELGQNLVWRAFRSGERMPDNQTLWEIGGDSFPYDDQIDMQDLERGREYLYRAAVEGRVYALIEISLSYAHQAAVERKKGDLSAEGELALRVEAFAYGEAVEQLVTGMPSSFFQSKVPVGERARANVKLSALIERFTLDRADGGLDVSALPSVDDDLLDGLNLCLK